MDSLQREIDLYPMLPPTVNEFVEFKEITKAQNVELNRIRIHLIGIFKDRFVLDATEHGVRRWEQVLKLKRKSTDTLEERKMRILVKMNNRLPYTFRAMIQRLNALCGVGNYDVILDANAYKLDFEFFKNVTDLKLVIQTMEDMVPVNLALDFRYVIAFPGVIITAKEYTFPVPYPITGTFHTAPTNGVASKAAADAKSNTYNFQVPYPITGAFYCSDGKAVYPHDINGGMFGEPHYLNPVDGGYFGDPYDRPNIDGGDF